MARITVEDCLKKTDSQYDLVLLAKERTSQLNAGDSALVPIENDKNTVLALREIAEGKISIKSLEDSGIDKLRKHKEETTDLDDIDDTKEDDFDKIYKGEISKSGTAILPSKRAKRMPEKVQPVSLEKNEKEDELEVAPEEEIASEEEIAPGEEVAPEEKEKETLDKVVLQEEDNS
tara:strand:- start:37 stop:564 length:528 start_codon:yes stop_codon:yes gene_type:complete